MRVEHNLCVMMMVGSVEWSIWLFSYAAQIVLLLRLWRLELWRIYRFFFAYLLVETTRTSVFLFLEPGTDAYGWTYVLFVPIFGVLYVLVILEVYGLVLRDYGGIVTLGRWVISGGLIVAFVISVLTLYPDVSNPAEKYPILLYFNVLKRSLVSALLVFLVFITAFLVWFPVPLNRNTVVHAIVFAAGFSSEALLLLIRNVAGHEPVRILSTVNLAVWSMCLVSWIVLLNRRGQETTVVFGHQWRREESDRLVEQLKTINTTLLRTARK